MNVEARPDPAEEMRDWWRTDIIEMKPGVIRFRGYAIEDLIGRVGFTQMIWLLLRGELPDPGQAMLLDNALMSGVDHGPQAPTIAIARMAATCGVGLNNAMATAVNVLGDVHGGAGEQAVRLATRWFPDSAIASTRSIRAHRDCSRSSTRRLPPGSFRASTRGLRGRSRPCWNGRKDAASR